ncbi:MAG: HEPN domain-containing protein [Planctomycetota bacterium]|nr:HEPN domain-containing protein [Planctomycetota bacterium]
MNTPADLARGWLRKAASDLAGGRRITGGRGAYDTACFHAQQAAEKSLKAVLAYYGAPIAHTHNLGRLAEEARVVAPALALDIPALDDLTPYAVELRYDTEFWPDHRTAVSALAHAARVHAAVLAVLPRPARPAKARPRRAVRCAGRRRRATRRRAAAKLAKKGKNR